MTDKQLHLGLLGSSALIFLWSWIQPYDQFTWFLEVLPVILGAVVLIKLYPRFKFTNVVYLLIWVHAAILMIGGHYTYAEMPVFNWLKESMDLQRNYYDRLGHFAQGFIPAMIAREVLLRKTPLTGGRWLFFIVVCICLALSATYELLEFAVALATGTAAEAFLGTQGDVWDTQWDMLFALCGAISAQWLLAKTHDRALLGKNFTEHTDGP
jgi:putative membrane protein